MDLHKLLDLSHVIEHGVITYEGLPAPIICDYLSREQSRQHYEPGTEFQIGKIEMVSNTGTYIDSPFHRYEDGADLAQVELHRFVELPGVLVRKDYRTGLAVTADDFVNVDVAGRAVLVNTNWSDLWGTDQYFENHPFWTEAAATHLRDHRAVLVGIDSHNIDDTRLKSRPAHSVLLAAGILIVEHMCNLAELRGKEFRFNAAPPAFKGVGTFPVRAYAVLVG